MERGGFHGYQKTPNANSGTEGLKLSEINYMRLSEMNQNGMGKNTNIVVNNNNNNNYWTTTNGDVESECTVREQDRFMPIANVIRIMRRILPAHAKISDDAKETIQECVSEYISFITGEANERCQKEQRKTITAEDVLWAMSKLGFDDYIEPLTVYLHRHREMEGERGSIRSEPTAANLMMMKRAMGDHYGSAGTFAAFHVGHHHHHHHHGGFFGYLKDSSAIPNAAAAAASTSSSHASQQPAGAAVTNGDHQPHAHAHFK